MLTTEEPPIVVYVRSLTREAQSRLYGSCPWTVRAVLHSLTPCAKQYVMRMLFLCPVDGGKAGNGAAAASPLALSRRTLDSWAKEGAEQSHLLALRQLGALGIIEWQDDSGGDDGDLEDVEVLGVEDEDDGVGSKAAGSGSAVMPSREALLRLQPGFQRHVLASLTQDADQPWRASPPPSSSGKGEGKNQCRGPVTSLRRLTRHERTRWDALLYYLVTCAEEGAEVPSHVVLELFVLAGLLDFDEESEDVRISRRGYEFVLSEADEQLWSLMQVYIAHRVSKEEEARGGGEGGGGRGGAGSVGGRVEEELISLLFKLAFFAKGMFGARAVSQSSRGSGIRAIPVSSLTASQRNVLSDLHGIGVVMLVGGGGGGGGSRGGEFFLPTPLAATLVFGRYGEASRSGGASSGGQLGGGAGGGPGTDAIAEANEGELAIVVETNFKVYAYTGTSGQAELHAKLLELFVDVKFLLPNLIVGTITKESVARALDSGIGAVQMNGFLAKHAHVHARAREPVVPENITDQVGVCHIVKEGGRGGAAHLSFCSSALFCSVLLCYARLCSARLGSALLPAREKKSCELLKQQSPSFSPLLNSTDPSIAPALSLGTRAQKSHQRGSHAVQELC